MTKLIGLTGRSGAGKSAAAAIFAELGFPLIDADAVYHAIISQDTPCTEELVATFGDEIRKKEGGIDRKKLGKSIFGKPNTADLLHSLNQITHKYIMANIRDAVRSYREKNLRAVILDAPQLFEANADRECDAVLGILAPDEVCIARITLRDGISKESAAQRLSAQLPAEFFRQRCTAVLENTGDLTALKAGICQFLKDIGV